MTHITITITDLAHAVAWDDAFKADTISDETLRHILAIALKRLAIASLGRTSLRALYNNSCGIDVRAIDVTSPSSAPDQPRRMTYKQLLGHAQTFFGDTSRSPGATKRDLLKLIDECSMMVDSIPADEAEEGDA